MNKIKFAISVTAIIIISFITIYLLYDKTNPHASIKLEFTSDQIISKALSLSSELGFETKKYHLKPDIRVNKKLVKQAQTNLGIEKSNEFLKKNPFAYNWEITFSSSEEVKKENRGPVVFIDDEQKISMSFDLNGNIVALKNNMIDTSQIQKITKSDGLILVKQFIEKYTSIKKYKIDTLNNSAGNIFKNSRSLYDYKYSFTFADSVLANKGNIYAGLYGNKVVNFSIDIEVPDEYDPSNYDLIPKISNFILMGILILFVVIISFKRIRNYEVELKGYFPIGIIAATFSGLNIYLSSNIEFQWELLIPIIIVPIFYFIFVIFIWAISESYTREFWKEKPISFDLIRNGFIDHSIVSKSFLSGFSGGFLILALLSVSVYLSDQIFEIFIFPFDQSNPFLNSRFPVLFLFVDSFFGIFTTIPLIVLIFPSIIKSKISNKFLFLAIFVSIGMFLKSSYFFPWEIGLVTGLISFVVFGFLILKFDFFSASVAYFTLIFFSGLIDLYWMKSDELIGIYLFAALFLIAFIIFTINLFTKDKVSDFEKITPKFAKYISERQRLQGELDVARKVQMSFLPTTNPKFQSLDISSECIPALEVGGDYYDFIQFDKNKLGIVIGDVTGKGTKAAFYMTLTKGFLKAIAKYKTEPAEVLTDINEVFYENVERGNFISMAFALFDIEKKRVKISRAGHNPILFRKSDSSKIIQIQSMGIAIGLEKGDIFSKSIKTEEIAFNIGDIFIFYTDGIPEAMNKNKEEYGMKKFEETIISNGNLSSSQLINTIYKDVRLFTKNVPQSDDMTCVVVKIN